MDPSTRKRIYVIIPITLFVICISTFRIYRDNHTAHRILMQTTELVAVNPEQAVANLEQIDRRLLTEQNYMLCDLLKAGALIHLQKYSAADSLLNFSSPYFRYKGDSLRLAESYYYKGEIARSSNFLFEAIEYYTLCTLYSNNTYDLRELHFYLNSFKGQVYHIKKRDEEEKEAKQTALKLAKELNNQEFIKEAYSELISYYTRVENGSQSIPVLKEAVNKGYSGDLQKQLLFLLSEKYAESHQPDSALIYVRQMPRSSQDSIDYLMGKIYFKLHRTDSARIYLDRSCRSSDPALCLKSYRQLLDLNVYTGSMNGVSDCLAKITHYGNKIDSIENKEMLSQIEDVEILRKTIRDTEAEEMQYYKYWIFYFWLMISAFVCILILLLVAVIQRKKKRDLQLKRQQARLDALKMQIDPHFIFNNLSILLDLVETGDHTAPHYVKALSKVYRHIISNVDNNLSTVENELSCLENYIFLLKIRFNNAIQIHVDVDDTIKGRQTPPVVLQMLLENAIKHNRASEESPLFIRIYSKESKLIVENDRKPITSSISNHHIGLRNIKERYSLIGAPAPEIYEDENIYRVTLSTL